MFVSLQNHVDVWIARRPDTVPGKYRELLSPDEISRATSFRFEHDRDFFVFCRGVLREILGQYLDLRPDEVIFEYGAAGKPSIKQAPDLSLNASHSGDLFVCAVSSGRELGIDVERIRPIDDWDHIARRFFAPRERQHLAGLRSEDRTIGFFQCWTRKEAVIKATGEGVTRPLDSFEVAFGPSVAPKLSRLDEELLPGWQMESFEPAEGYIAALASPVPWNSTKIHGWNRNPE